MLLCAVSDHGLEVVHQNGTRQAPVTFHWKKLLRVRVPCQHRPEVQILGDPSMSLELAQLRFVVGQPLNPAQISLNKHSMRVGLIGLSSFSGWFFFIA